MSVQFREAYVGDGDMINLWEEVKEQDYKKSFFRQAKYIHRYLVEPIWECRVQKLTTNRKESREERLKESVKREFIVV